jgi:PBS lyase HEAT-like repeat
VKKWFRIAFAMVMAGVLGEVVCQVVRLREPVYDGKSLSEWLEQFSGDEGPLPQEPTQAARAEAASAICHFGTNAIPYLLKMAAAKDSAAKKWFLNVLAPQEFAAPLLSQPQFYRWATKSVFGPMEALNGFKLLGPAAKDAVPGLVNVMRTSSIRRNRLLAVSALGELGPTAEEAIPALIDNLEDSFEELRDRTVGALSNICFDGSRGQLRPECSRMLVPALAELLADPRTDMLRVIRLLSDFGPDAKAALPAINMFLNCQDLSLRTAATKARERIAATADDGGPLDSQAVRSPFSGRDYRR